MPHKNPKQYFSKYRKTKKGVLVQAYASMLKRVNGKVAAAMQYAGLPLLKKEEFYAWALEDTEFARLHEQWVESSYNRALSPPP